MVRLAGCSAPAAPSTRRTSPDSAAARPRGAPLDVQGQADLLAAWMRVLGLERAAFLGHSLGSQVVAHLASRHPRARGTSDPGGPDRSTTRAERAPEILRLLRDVPREPFSLIPLVAADYLRAGPARILRTLRYALADPMEEKLPAPRDAGPGRARRAGPGGVRGLDREGLRPAAARPPRRHSGGGPCPPIQPSWRLAALLTPFLDEEP